ncbi:hypothetical protein N7481_003220 [Penicillium waksmanii]|uniref:uncharacterized protein n=1 Tax=Penicillium waksmanii TaxID=69791 RepID=UPI0025481500|nr:uncharacterized protein N7481_003220 [Penicillium waksmanii]KAJ5988010.1 hypothetical protein N7481_003220 [Penicillium waksmanii]
MKHSHIFWVVALGVSTSCLGAETKECDTATNVVEDGTNVLELHTPDQLDAFEGCTTLNGHIVIQSDYAGEFILNGVTELHGNISTASSGSDGLHLFEMRNLEKVNHIDLFLAGDVHLPSLNSTGNLKLVQKSGSGKIDLKSLVEADNVSIRGSWPSTDFSSLKTVTVACEFYGYQVYGGSPDGTLTHIVVDLPSLEKADYFDLSGTVESVSLPKLEVLGYIEHTDLFPAQGLSIRIEDEETLDFDAPKLHTLNGELFVYGGSKLGFFGQDHRYGGELRSIYLPDMDDLGDVDLSYYPRIPCNDTLYQLWEGQSENSSDWDDYNSCLNYDFLQEDEETDRASTTVITTPTATTTPGVTEITTSGSGTKTAADDPDSTESPSSGNAARQALSIPSTSVYIMCETME